MVNLVGWGLKGVGGILKKKKVLSLYGWVHWSVTLVRLNDIAALCSQNFQKNCGNWYILLSGFYFPNMQKFYHKNLLTEGFQVLTSLNQT